MCYDHNISITYAPDSPPPLYLCIECANEIHRENPNQTFGDILHPMAQVSMICENKVSISCGRGRIHFTSRFYQFCRIVVRPTRRPYRFAFQRNVRVTMAIIPSDIAPSAMAIDTTVDAAAIILCIAACRRLGKWTRKCKRTWLRQ